MCKSSPPGRPYHKDNGGRPRFGKRFVGDPQDVVTMYLNGASTVELGAVFNLTPSGIGLLLKRQGIALRTSKEAARLLQARLSPEARKKRFQACLDASHTPEAVKKRNTKENREKLALGRERVGSGIMAIESSLHNYLIAKGIPSEFIIPQKAVGPYNLDLAIADTIAVEVFSQSFYGHLPGGWKDRVKYLMEHGWHILVVLGHNRSRWWLEGAHTQLLNLINLRTDRSQYWMVGRRGQLLYAADTDIENLPRVPDHRQDPQRPQQLRASP